MYKLYPVSLKGKKSEELLKSLQDQKIDFVLDVRRKNSRSAQWFYPSQLKDFLPPKGVEYVNLPELGNYSFAKNSSDYFSFVTKEYQKIIADQPEFDFKNKIQLGILCYCTEKAQSNNNCHASWLAQQLFIDLNRPLFQKIESLCKSTDYDDNELFFDILQLFPTIHNSSDQYSDLVDISDIDSFTPDFFKDEWKRISDKMFNEGIVYETRPNIIAISY